jgi:P-type Mg2+ transporter
MILTDLYTGLRTAQIVSVDAPKTSKYRQTLSLAWTIVRGQITSIFFILLLVSAVISFALGEYTDAIILSVINIANVLLAFIQEFRASKAAEKLEAMVKTRVRVRRDGVVVQLEAAQVVVGDIIEMITGDIFAVDVVAREVSGAQIDNSVRTGETLPVSVLEGQECLAGGVVVSGKILGQVTAVGSKTSLAQYANRLDTVKKGSSFDMFITKISKSILIVALVLLAVVAVFVVVIVPKLTLIQFLLFSIALLVGIVPESLPLIITIMLTREALALAKYNVIVKRLSALQELGAIDFLLTDKTGTLTQNNIAVSSFSCSEVGEVAAGIATASYEREPMDTVFDTAIARYMSKAQTSVVSRLESYNAQRGYARYYLATGDQVVRGQIEKVSGCCQTVGEHEVEYVKNQENAGRRTLSYAIQSATGSQFVFLGSVSFEDPLKPDAADSIRKAELLGVDLKIITGDTRAVAESVALAVEVAKTSEQVMDARGISVDTLSPETLRTTEVYARATPEQKLALIDVYQKQGAVAFLGEGINDALALKRADVGIVVDNASDVARQSADILLLDKGLAPVLKGIEMGRKTYHHIATYLLCTLAGNAGTLISLVGVTLFWHDLPLLPVQILLNNLLTDVPLIFLISDTVSRQELLRPPDQAVLPLIRKIFLFGALSSLFDFVYFGLFVSQPLDELRTGWFVFSVLSELVLVIALRTRLPLSQAPRMSGVLVATLFCAAGTALALPFIPVVSMWFAFVPLPLSSLAILGVLVLVYIGANEVCKAIISRKSH